MKVKLTTEAISSPKQDLVNRIWESSRTGATDRNTSDKMDHHPRSTGRSLTKKWDKQEDRRKEDNRRHRKSVTSKLGH